MLRDDNGKRIPLDFDLLQMKSVERTEKNYFPIDSWSPTDWGCAMAGEAGEACNFAKKLLRLERAAGTLSYYRKRIELINNIGKELADVVIYASLFAERVGLNLGNEVIKKFNEVSRRVDSKIFIGSEENDNG